MNATESNPCQATGCAIQAEPIQACRDRSCAYRWRREAVEDRQQREAKDAARKRELAADPTSTCMEADCIGMANPVEDCEQRRCPFVGDRREART